MASIVLAAAGASIGAGFGGTILGLSGAVIGQAAGSIIGTIIDSRIIASSPRTRSPKGLGWKACASPPLPRVQ